MVGVCPHRVTCLDTHTHARARAHAHTPFAVSSQSDQIAAVGLNVIRMKGINRTHDACVCVSVCLC
jgi:hypothetical protein